MEGAGTIAEPSIEAAAGDIGDEADAFIMLTSGAWEAHASFMNQNCQPSLPYDMLEKNEVFSNSRCLYEETHWIILQSMFSSCKASLASRWG